MYYVFEVYYKHGSYSIESFNSMEYLRSYLISQATNEDKFFEVTDVDVSALPNLSLTELIDVTKIYGDYRIENQCGSGIVEVMREQF